MKILKRILVGLLAVVLLLVVFLAASIVVDAAIGTGRMDAVTNLTIPGRAGGPDVHAFVASPPGEGPFPALILIHEFFGLNESIVGKAQALAEEGYLVVAPDTFRGATTAWIPRAIYQVLTTRPEQVSQDLDAVFTWLEGQPQVDAKRIGIAGFCYGGRVSLNYSLHNPRLATTVMFYGSPMTEVEVLKALPGPLLGIFGGADRTIPLEQVSAFEAALDQAGIPNEITVYEGQPHAFVTDMEAVNAGGAAGEAWDQMLRFLEEHLKQGEAAQAPDQASSENALFEWRYYLMLVYEHAFGSASHRH
jgi:carboxymethylenebutenolidase